MNRLLFAAAIAAATALAIPGYAQMPAANPNPQEGPAAEQPAPASQQPAGGEQGGGMPWMHGGGGMAMHGGPMMRREMWGRRMMGWNPQQRCIDRLARRAAVRAYLETELNLTPEQRPLWDRLQSIAQGEQQRERELCNQARPQEELTMLDRLDRMQQFLSSRLEALQAAKPAVQALYQSLSPEQREIFDHPFRRD
jgi:LTXXQ motif family protein